MRGSDIGFGSCNYQHTCMNRVSTFNVFAPVRGGGGAYLLPQVVKLGFMACNQRFSCWVYLVRVPMSSLLSLFFSFSYRKSHARVSSNVHTHD